MNQTGVTSTSFLSSLCIIAMFFVSACNTSPQTQFRTDVLVIGGGASGTMASIQAARLGSNVIVVEETEWLGGMLTSAGVAAIDGNHMLPGGLWGEFRAKLRAHYGGAEAVETGWVSNTLFEPHIGHQILSEMVAAESKIKVLHGYRVVDILKDGDRVIGARFVDESGETIEVISQVTIAADEYGDALALSGAAYRFGFESRSDYGDLYAPETGNDLIQDLTYVAILKDFGPDADMTIPEPDGYDSSVFDGTCKQLSSDPNRDVVDCGPESGKDLYMLNYGELPNNHFMINWPIHGNDYYIPILDMPHEGRHIELEKAKNFTLQWIYFIQTQGGYKNLGIADDIFPTEDNLPMIPYIRESRRVVGVTTLRTQDLLDPYSENAAGRFRHAIAVGDYPLDLHHERKPAGFEVDARTEDLPKIPSYSVPYGTMIPEVINGLIVAEKSISTTHIVNGATRLQPVVMLIGQAAGVAAALSVQAGVEPRDLDIRSLQQTLLDAGSWLMPFADVTPADHDFQAIQRVGLSGLMLGTGEPSAWANRTWFYPDREVDRVELMAINRRLAEQGWEHELGMMDRSNLPVNRELAIRAVWEWSGSPGLNSDVDGAGRPSGEEIAEIVQLWFSELGVLSHWTPSSNSNLITRREMAQLIDASIKPFEHF
jgi:hypothetical protein